MTNNNGNGLEKLLTSAQVCEGLNISRRTLRRYCKMKLINYIPLPGGDFRFRQSAVELFINQREIKRSDKLRKPVHGDWYYSTRVEELTMTDAEARAFFATQKEAIGSP
jgi:excisionase family DNA binding protein